MLSPRGTSGAIAAHYLTAILMAGGIACAAGAAAAQAQAPGAAASIPASTTSHVAAVIDPAAEARLLRVANDEQKLRSVTGVSTELETNPRTGAAVTLWTYKFSLQRPNLAHLEFQSASANADAPGGWKTPFHTGSRVSDGGTVTSTYAARNEYKRAPASPTGSSLSLGGFAGVVDFFDTRQSFWAAVERYKAAGRLLSLTDAGIETYEGKSYSVVTFTYADDSYYPQTVLDRFGGRVSITERLYIGADDLVHREVVTGDVVRVNRDRVLTEFNPATTFPKDEFALVLPVGATDITKGPNLLPRGPSAPDFAAQPALAESGALPPDIHLSDYRGKIVVLDFWATWCHPCQQAMPHLKVVHDSVSSKDVVFLGVCVWDQRTAYDTWIHDKKATYPFVFAFDPAGKTANQSIAEKLYHVDGIPTTYVIDRDGHVSASIVDYVENDTRLERALRSLGVAVNLFGAADPSIAKAR